MLQYWPLLATDYKGRFAQIIKFHLSSLALRLKIWSGQSLLNDQDFGKAHVIIDKEKPVSDMMMSEDKFLVVSDSFKSACQGYFDQVEWLPLTTNLKEPYFLFNPLRIEDILDLKRSQLSWSLKQEGLLRAVGPMFKERQVEQDVFRLRYFPYYVLATESGRKKIDQHGFSGLKWGDFVNTEMKFPAIDVL